jgi:hypothetical protein
VPRRRVTGDYDQQKPSLPHSRPRDRYGDGITVVVGKGAFVRFPSAGGGVVDIPRCHSNGIPLRDFATWASAHRAELPIDG